MKNELTVTKAMKKLQRKGISAIRKGKNQRANDITQAMVVLEEVHARSVHNSEMKANQSSNGEIQRALVQAMKYQRGSLSFKAVKSKMNFTPNAADQNKYDGGTLERWDHRSRVALRYYSKLGWAQQNTSTKEWNLTSEGKKNLKSKGYF